jgi:hypothetical protein
MGGEFSFGGMFAIKLPLMKEAALGDDVLSFKASDPVVITNDSTKSTLLRMLRAPGLHEYVVINLGSGKEWVTSRPFIFTIMLQHMKGIRCVVFTEGSVPKFLGIVRPDRIRWCLAQAQPCLERAYLTALDQGIQNQVEPFVNDAGALDSQIADTVVRNFIREVGPNTTVCIGAQPPSGKQWAQLGNSTEYGVWISGVDVQRMLGTDKAAIFEAADQRAEASFIRFQSSPYRGLPPS